MGKRERLIICKVQGRTPKHAQDGKAAGGSGAVIIKAHFQYEANKNDIAGRKLWHNRVPCYPNLYGSLLESLMESGSSPIHKLTNTSHLISLGYICRHGLQFRYIRVQNSTIYQVR